ncbi:MAG: PEP-CTERM sorting domain-containing protein [Acidobacteria bacterium]|nr:PEP-CTERM sorting domain-containing protein [Acidobacteriota bacterium]
MFQTLFRAGLLAAVLAGTALADPILVTFEGPGSGLAGTFVTLTASVTNTSGVAKSLDGLSFTLVSPFVNWDDSPFFSTWPLSLDAAGPGSQFGPAPIFLVEIPVGTPAALYAGNQLNVYGDGGFTLLTTQSFDIEVLNDSVPEPSTVGLIAAGIAAFAILRRHPAQPNIRNP